MHKFEEIEHLGKTLQLNKKASSSNRKMALLQYTWEDFWDQLISHPALCWLLSAHWQLALDSDSDWRHRGIRNIAAACQQNVVSEWLGHPVLVKQNGYGRVVALLVL